MSGGRLALVTGGHRRLGAAIAGALAEAGYAIAIHGSHDADPDAGLAATLAASGRDWRGFVADFSDPAAGTGLMAEVTAHFGRAPDLLVNGASLFGQDRLQDTDADALMNHYAVNCAAPALLTQAFAAVGGGGRSIVNILDQRIDQPHGDQLAYTLSKMALAGLTRISARDLAPAIRVNAVAPGLTLPTADYDAAQMRELADAMPLDLLPTPEDIAAAVLYLAGAKAVTGQTLYVDAGARMESWRRDFLHIGRTPET